MNKKQKIILNTVFFGLTSLSLSPVQANSCFMPIFCKAEKKISRVINKTFDPNSSQQSQQNQKILNSLNGINNKLGVLTSSVGLTVKGLIAGIANHYRQTYQYDPNLLSVSSTNTIYNNAQITAKTKLDQGLFIDARNSLNAFGERTNVASSNNSSAINPAATAINAKEACEKKCDAKKSSASATKSCKSTCNMPPAPAMTPIPTSLSSVTTSLLGPDSLNTTSKPYSQFSAENNAFAHDTNFNSLFNNPSSLPFAYSTTYAKNYLKILTNKYNFDAMWYNLQPIAKIQSDLKKYQNNPSNTKAYITNLQSYPDFLAFKAKFRAAIAARSMIMTTFSHLLRERECPGNCSTSPSPLALEHQMATWRIHNKKWYKQIAAASPATLAREQVTIMAEMEAELYQAHLDRERTQSLLALMALELQQQQAMTLSGDAMNLKKVVKDAESSVSSS